MSNMQIFVDADACSVVGIVEKIAKKYNISLTLLCDTNHVLYSDYSEEKKLTFRSGRYQFTVVMPNLNYG